MSCQHTAGYICELCSDGPECAACRLARVVEEQAAEIAALRERLKTYQRAVLWCWGWINHALAEELVPEEFASSIEDDRWNEVGSLVGEATDEVDP